MPILFASFVHFSNRHFMSYQKMEGEKILCKNFFEKLLTKRENCGIIRE